jgi:hypothetical protein
VLIYRVTGKNLQGAGACLHACCCLSVPAAKLQARAGAPTGLAIRQDGDMVPRQRRVQQLLYAAERHDVALAGVRAEAGMEAELALHAGAAGARHDDLRAEGGGVGRVGAHGPQAARWH